MSLAIAGIKLWITIHQPQTPKQQIFKLKETPTSRACNGKEDVDVGRQWTAVVMRKTGKRKKKISREEEREVWIIKRHKLQSKQHVEAVLIWTVG